MVFQATARSREGAIAAKVPSRWTCHPAGGGATFVAHRCAVGNPRDSVSGADDRVHIYFASDRRLGVSRQISSGGRVEPGPRGADPCRGLGFKLFGIPAHGRLTWRPPALRNLSEVPAINLW